MSKRILSVLGNRSKGGSVSVLPLSTRYQCEYPGLYLWEPEKWEPEKRSNWEQSVERIAARIDATPKAHLSHRLAEEIKAYALVREYYVRHGEGCVSFASIRAELHAAIREAKKELGAQISKSKCHCQAANLRKNEVSHGTEKREENHTV
ncbi:hypothetical protein FKW77_001112 [Venturia effusa]|uniref:Uncharacterized protein n=1 Tax=Venturia effusa TaxID=50376 RepID=A0A517L4U1_9PEZI|nr:hypothetical protein FKW77_001112 [Venturia effusa]